MGLVKKCIRCGCLHLSESEVCQDCKVKDSADIVKLKSFMENSFNSGTTKQDILESTGISFKNLDRYLGYEEFSGIYLGNDNGINNSELGLEGIVDAK